MPPWVYEELVCVSAYFMAIYEPINEEIRDGLNNLSEERGVDFFWDLPEDERPPDLSATSRRPRAVPGLHRFVGVFRSRIPLSCFECDTPQTSKYGFDTLKLFPSYLGWRRGLHGVG